MLLQKHMMVLMRSLCKGSSTSLLPKSDVITLTALLKAAKTPAGCTIPESGLFLLRFEVLQRLIGMLCCVYEICVKYHQFIHLVSAVKHLCCGMLRCR